MSWIDEVKFDAQGLIPAIAQDVESGRILMVAWMDHEALQQTVETGQAVYYSRSRQRLWPKGESSGHVQKIQDIQLDCDGDVILLKVEQIGGIACHTGRESCFFRQLTPQGWQVTESVLKTPESIYGQVDAAPALQHAPTTVVEPNQPYSADILTILGDIILQRKLAASEKSYVASLYQKGLNKILEKVGEEATEVILAAKDADTDKALVNDMIYETADLWFHTLVMLGHYNIQPAAILNELGRRFGLSGLEEKANRSA